MLLNICNFTEYNVIYVFLSHQHMGHGSYVIGHGSLLEWFSGSWVTVSDPLPARDD